MDASLSPESRTQALSGLSMARPYELQRGQVIYRFYDRRRAPTPMLGAQGSWWFEFEHFQTIKHFALRHGYSLSYAARLFAAVLYEWSEVDAFVACRTTRSIPGWKGRGRQIRQDELSKTSRDPRDLPTMTPMQGMLEVYQLFVPGLSGPQSKVADLLQVQNSGLLT